MVGSACIKTTELCTIGKKRITGHIGTDLIKNNQEFRRTPVIMLSSKDGLFDRARGRIVGSEQYLTKPFTKDELLGAISNQIN